MSFNKIGESISVDSQNIKFEDSSIILAEIDQRFYKFAKDLKAIAPKANDFLYFTAIMMHAAEASLLDEKGQLRKHADGTPVTARWEKKDTPNGPSYKWICSDPSIKPYKNRNGDIFPAFALKEAYKQWVGKPLCIDHQSSSVDHVRGIIVDTYFDEPSYRIISLNALDKKNYPDLARKVESKYSTCVSMGTGVTHAICYDCGTVAKVEADFCDCMKFKRCYGEINVGLNPIELSIVVNGADPKAKIRQIMAAADSIAQYVEQKNLNSSDNFIEKLNALSNEIEEIKREAKEQNLKPSDLEISTDQNVLNFLGKLAHQIEDLTNKVSNILINQKGNQMADKNAYYQGTDEPTPGKPKYPKEEADAIRMQDKHMQAQNTGPVDGMHPGYDSFGESEEARKKRLQRLAEEEERRIKRQAILEKVKREMNKNSYYQGTDEPTPGKPKYPKEEADKLRNEDKHMVGQSPFPGVGNVDGLHPSPESADVKDELKRKQMLHRANEKLSAKLIRTATPSGSVDPKTTRWEIYQGDNLILNATLWDVAGDKYQFHYKTFSDKPFAKNLMNKIRAEGIEAIQMQLKKNAQAQTQMPAMPQASDPSMGGGSANSQAMGLDGMPEPKMDEGGDGNPAENLLDKVQEMENLVSDLRQGVSALTSNEAKEEMTDFKNLAETGQMSPTETQALAYETKTNQLLVKAFKESIKKASDLIEDLKFSNHIYENAFSKMSNSDKKEFTNLVVEALDESNELVSNAHLLSKALVKYARGRQFMIKKAEMLRSASRVKKAQDVTAPVPGKIYHAGDPFMPLDATPGVPYTPSAGSTSQTSAPTTQVRKTVPAKPKEQVGPEKVDDKLPTPYGERKNLDSMLQSATKAISGQQFSGQAQKTPQPMNAAVSVDAGKPDAKPVGGDKAKADDSNDLKMNPDGSLDGRPEEVGKAMKEKEASMDLSTKESRAAWRAKLAQKAVSFSDMLKVHKGGVVPGGFDTKPSGDLAKIETLEETHKAMMDLANAPPKVRKQAEEISKLVAKGEISESDFPSLIAAGLDVNAVKLYQNSKEKNATAGLASELNKEYQEAKLAKDKENIEVKFKRAYELAQEMSEKGFGSGTAFINKQAQELYGYTDETFNQVKKYINSLPSKKITASVPVVGSMQSVLENTPIPSGNTQEDLVNKFAQAFASSKNKY